MSGRDALRPDPRTSAPDGVAPGEQLADRDAATGRAERQQNMASDPDVSAFVSASAGSGKTKLLVDRLLRLMLPRVVPGDAASREGGGRLVRGTDPGRIQCLTFTRAAAAEMAIRLQRELGRWVTMDDAALDRRLQALGADGGAAGPEALREPARALFARVLDLPGGMRIGTIHAFCQSLLRRFPVEARVSPHFQLVEEADSRLALNRAWEEELAARSGSPEVAVLSAQVTAADAVRLLGRLQERAPLLGEALAMARGNPEELRRALRRAAGVRHDTEADCRREAVALPNEADLASVLREAIAVGTSALRAKAEAMADWLSLGEAERLARWGQWCALFLTASGAPRAAGGFVAGKLAAARPEIAAAMVAEAERLVAVEERCRAIRTAELTAALLLLAGPVLARYGESKRLRGLVDYDDLIARTIELLRDPGSAWVLFKLDGGIDHLLLDEVQDTSELQWQIAGALTEEFFAGEGAVPSGPPSGPGGTRERPLPRTVFAVGDYKQSIYSFQGADPAAFHGWHERFRERVWDGRAQWREPELTVSFRSVEPVLEVVDAVFALPEAARGVVEPGRAGGVRHESARPGAPGRVELWPAVPASDQEEDEPGANGEDDPWRAPNRNRGRRSAPRRLAEALARTIRDRIGAPDPDGGAPLAPGDVLVLVPRRSGFVRALIRALKAQGVPVATLVRTALIEQVAVQDLLALCDALLLPTDDLALGCVLTSPLGGLSDDALMALAAERNGVPLWDRLRERAHERADWAAAWAFLSELFARVDFIAPHALLGEALGRGGGRARLLRRLGAEAAEPVDELLAAAQRFDAGHPPSLQGFLHWLRRSEESVKREPDAAGNAVRVMTVHGAKGLQARLVVLPDTMSTAPGDDTLLWRRGDGMAALPFWVPRAAFDSAPTRRLREAMRADEAAENNRLLYVALTRAADGLLVCGWESGRGTGRGGGVPEDSWYALCRRGLQDAGAVAEPFGGEWGGNALVLRKVVAAGGLAAEGPAAELAAGLAVVQAAGPEPAVGAERRAEPPLPSWMGRSPDWIAAPPPVEPPLPEPLAPSRPLDGAFGPLPAARSPLNRLGAGAGGGVGLARRGGDAFRRGRLVHRLLQHLPELPPAARDAAARRFLAAGPDGLDAADAARVAARVAVLLGHPELAPLFDRDALVEQPVAGLADGVVVSGQVDRMRVLPDRVLLCDFKSNRSVPDAVDAVPLAYLRQMAAYRVLLRALYPDRSVRCFLVWTEQAAVMALPDALLDRHLPHTYRSGSESGAGVGVA